MERNDDLFSPEGIDDQIEQRRSVQSRPTPGDALMHDLLRMARSEQQLDSRSLEQVWQRLQAQGAPPITREAQQKPFEENIIYIKERKAMEKNESSQGMSPLTPGIESKRRRPPLQIVGISLIAAVAIITIVSFTVFSGVLRPAPQTAGSKSTITGAQPPHTGAQPAKTISNAQLVCSLGVDDRPLPPFKNANVLVDWPVQGKVVAHATGGSVIFSGKDCSGKKTFANENYQALGSPDGKKIMTSSYNNNTLDIEDSNGNIIKSVTFAQLGVKNIFDKSWSYDSTKIIFMAEEANHVATIKSVDADGGNLKTLIKVDRNKGTRGFLSLSPGGKYAVMSDFNVTTEQKDMSIWDVNTGKKVSDLLSDNGKGEFNYLAFSPDSSLMAISGNNQINIVSAANGKVMSTLDYKGAEKLAWSPDGKYLAACNTSISIYDVNSKQAVTTFGKVADPAKQKVSSLAWSPDGTGLVSSLEQPDDGKTPTPVNIWALS